MKVIYDQEVDVITILLGSGQVVSSDEEKPGVIFDFDAEGNVVSLEILDASKRLDPRVMEYAVRG